MDGPGRRDVSNVCKTLGIFVVLIINLLGIFLPVIFRLLIILPTQGHANEPLSDSLLASPSIKQSTYHEVQFP